MDEDIINLLDLPNVVIIEIFERLPYDEVAKKRIVCRRFDQICQQILNCGFKKVIKQHTDNLKRIKALLPRRESERRMHYLARHADVLTSIETRISMLSMTYNKYIDSNLCCFIPGGVLDEIFRIFRLISKTSKPLRPHEVLQELRDISSMAIEHFDEYIAADLKKALENGCSDKNCRDKYCLDKKRTFAARGGGRVPFSGMGGSTAPTPHSTSTVSGNNTFEQTQLLSFFGESSVLNTLKSTLNESPESAATPMRMPIRLLDYTQSSEGCKDARVIMENFRQFEIQYKLGVDKTYRMQQAQNLQNTRIQNNLISISELKGQITELKKRLEVLDAKNRELSEIISHMNGSVPTNSKNDTDSNSTIKEEGSTTNTTVGPTSSNTVNTLAQTCENNSKKIHNDSNLTIKEEGSTTNTSVGPTSSNTVNTLAQSCDYNTKKRHIYTDEINEIDECQDLSIKKSKYP